MQNTASNKPGAKDMCVYVYVTIYMYMYMYVCTHTHRSVNIFWASENSHSGRSCLTSLFVFCPLHYYASPLLAHPYPYPPIASSQGFGINPQSRTLEQPHIED